MIYQMAELKNTQQRLTEREILEFETSLARKLPEAFRNHYIAFNGGAPAEEDVERGEWGLPVHGFNPIKHGRLTVERLINDLDVISPEESPYGSWVKLSFVPFAYDAGAHLIFLSLRNQDYESIYIYDPDGGAIKKIADSFEEFLSRLYRNGHNNVPGPS